MTVNVFVKYFDPIVFYDKWVVEPLWTSTIKIVVQVAN